MSRHPGRRGVDEALGARQRRAHVAFCAHASGIRRGQSIHERAGTLVNGVYDDKLASGEAHQ